MCFQNLKENLKNLDKNIKTWMKFRKLGKSFKKTYGHHDFLKENFPFLISIVPFLLFLHQLKNND